MKYDLVKELLRKNAELELSQAEQDVLDSVFSDIKVKEVDFVDNDLDSEYKSICKVSLVDGNNVIIKFKQDENNIDSYMFVDLDLLKNGNNKFGNPSFYIQVRNGEICGGAKFNFTVSNSEGYYIIKNSHIYLPRHIFPLFAINVNFYDKEAEMYYKFRSGKSEFSNPTTEELEYYGISPDYYSTLARRNSCDGLKIFRMILDDPNNFINNLLEITPTQTKSKNK